MHGAPAGRCGEDTHGGPSAAALSTPRVAHGEGGRALVDLSPGFFERLRPTTSGRQQPARVPRTSSPVDRQRAQDRGPCLSPECNRSESPHGDRGCARHGWSALPRAFMRLWGHRSRAGFFRPRGRERALLAQWARSGEVWESIPPRMKGLAVQGEVTQASLRASASPSRTRSLRASAPAGTPDRWRAWRPAPTPRQHRRSHAPASPRP